MPRVRRFHQVAEIVLRAEVGVDGREVRGPVAVEAVGLARAFIGAVVDLLHRRRQPDRIHAQTVEIAVVDFVDDAGQIAAHKAAQRRCIGARS
jgi:hypothetical protein